MLNRASLFVAMSLVLLLTACGKAEKSTRQQGKAFYMGKYEVTQQQYQQVMGTNPSQSKGFDLPLEMASWDNAREFCQKIAEKTGQAVRLPTEAEWEYACRGGGASIYSTGNSEAHLDQLGWYDKNSGDMSLSFPDGQKTHPVGQKIANGWGLYDMHGNVWEWCHDKFHSYGPMAVIDPQGPDAPPELCWSRVIRGGSFGSNMDWCRSASRYNETSVTRKKDLGFRVAVSLPKAP